MPGFKKLDKFERKKNTSNMGDSEGDAKSIVDKILGDVSKTSATKQLIIGASSGWLTGYLAMKIGKTAACAIGGGIILLEIANEKGYINVNWDKVNRQIDKVSDKVEEKVTGQGPNLVDKMERYVDRKLDKAEEVVKDRKAKAKRWYSSVTGNNDGKLKEIHIFLMSFAAGVALGIATS
ncbi:hypothetical protein ILUMI_25695 [Ignelater luminosus]|uniref:FUN14 domain-containing protein 1 n=1 Tax=Ignelater luminosus TaxID=2038154 RepID=A0A8K0C9G9_IGNLU|nr:hypothetical protein ILUMI_25695 [Ignelater luminosus]